MVADTGLDGARSKQVGADEKAEITLSVLNAIEANSAVTQRVVANDVGIALGLANSYLKRCIRKGLVKVQQVPANRYTYYLTPKGFSEKSRLTAEYLTTSFNFFRSSRDQCAQLFQTCVDRRWNRVALAGCGDLAEIATLCVRDETDVDIVGIIHTGDASAPRPEQFAGFPVVNRLSDLTRVHAVVLTDILNAQMVFDELSRAIPPERILTAPLLKVSRMQPRLADD